MLSTYDVQEIKRLREASKPTCDQTRAALRVLKDVAALSSGTLATLSGCSRYEDLDAIQSGLVAIAKTLATRERWTSWQQVWDFYSDSVCIGSI